MSVEESVTRESAAPSGPVVHVRPRLTHVAIFVHDRDKMADFYLNVMGLIKTDAGRGISAPVDLFFMTSEATEHHQFVLVTGRPKEATFSTVQQLSFLVDSLAQLREMHRRATNYGVNGMRSISHGNAWSIYFKDPEANLIEVYMHTPWYVPQPRADPLDLSKSDKEIHRITEATCRKDAGFCFREEWIERTRVQLEM
jgi:catechol-2,3-dioxygenase